MELLVDKANALKTAPVADYMKIRQYVVELSARSLSGQDMIPSMNELAKRFGVTRMTVHKALKDLIRDEYLIVRKGIGTFVNPARRACSISGGYPCVGLVVADGKNCFYDAFFWDLVSYFGRAVAARRWNVKLMNLSGSSPEEMAREIKDAWVDGLLWLDPLDALSRSTVALLRESFFPVVSVDQDVPGVFSVDMDWARSAYEVGRLLLAEGRRNIVFVDYAEHSSRVAHMTGLKRAFDDAGANFNERLVLSAGADLKKEFDEIFAFGVDVQAVYIPSPRVAETVAVLRAHGVDVKDHCRIVAEPYFLDGIEDFHGIVRKYKFEEEAMAAVEMMARLLRDPEAKPERRLFEFEIEYRGGTGR